MASDIDIVSNALILIGDEPISSFTEPGFGATAAANLYPTTYEDLLVSHPWSFAFKELFLSRLSQAPAEETGYQYAYQLPADYLRNWQTFEHSDFVIVGDLLYSNLNKILMRYIYKVPESQLPPHFVKALEYKLASEFALLITENANYAAVYEDKYRAQIAKAMGIDSQNRPQSMIMDSPFVDVRHGGRGYWSGSSV